MKIGSAFPSKYIKAADLQGRAVVCTIREVRQEDIGDGEKKPVLYFEGKEKGMVLNRTNAKSIASACGSDETDDWPGCQIEIYPTETDFQGERVDCIRVRLKRPAAPVQPTRRAEPPPASPGDYGAAPSDDIPF